MLEEMDANFDLFDTSVLQNVVNVIFSKNFDQGPPPPSLTRRLSCRRRCHRLRRRRCHRLRRRFRFRFRCSPVFVRRVRTGINLALELAKRFNRADRWTDFIPIAASVLSPSIFEALTPHLLLSRSLRRSNTDTRTAHAAHAAHAARAARAHTARMAALQRRRPTLPRTTKR
jgi:hypothetical protein